MVGAWKASGMSNALGSWCPNGVPSPLSRGSLEGYLIANSVTEQGTGKTVLSSMKQFETWETTIYIEIYSLSTHTHTLQFASDSGFCGGGIARCLGRLGRTVGANHFSIFVGIEPGIWDIPTMLRKYLRLVCARPGIFHVGPRMC